MFFTRLLHPLNDISTDTGDPPAYLAAGRLRKSWYHPVNNGPDANHAARQQHLYPDIAPFISHVPAHECWLAAMRTSKALGWQLIGSDSDRGYIEAVAITPLLRFHDDVVIRIRQQGTGSRLDIRSASRIGRSDLGANAARIRRFLAHLRREL